MPFTPKPVRTFKSKLTAAPDNEETVDIAGESQRQVKALDDSFKKSAEAFAAEADTQFFCVVVFKSQAQRAAFLKAVGTVDSDLVNGLEVARKLKLKLPADPPLKDHKLQQRWKDLVKRF